jgi:hypothetical protein
MKKITAQEGTYLTQSVEVPIEDRIYCTELICPDEDENKWREASQKEYEEWIRKQENEEIIEDENE